MDGAFRKIDIDAYDEDVLHEEELYDADPREPSQVLDEAKQRQVAVRSALSKCVHCIISQFVSLTRSDRSDIAGALSIVLENAPYGPTFDDAKVIHRCTYKRN